MLHGKDFHKCNHFLEMRFPGNEVSSADEGIAKNLQSVRQALCLKWTKPQPDSQPSPSAVIAGRGQGVQEAEG